MPESPPQQRKHLRPRSHRRPDPGRGAPRGVANFLVVGIGASAGGLEACTKLVGALGAGDGMAFILVQHLDPTHESMMVELLATRTSMNVRQAEDGMPIQPEHFYVIPPGSYLSVRNGTLHLSQPEARHGARLPFDFLLRSLAEEYGARAVCVILSGTGADGSLGLKAVREKCGLIITQDPEEAAYDGMPRSAIMTGVVDLVLPVAKIPRALVKYDRRMVLAPQNGLRPPDEAQGGMRKIINLLRTKTAHDFTLYKQGTLQRRIEQRMAMAAIETDDIDGYLDLLRSDTAELDLLAKDLLINVTSFFRDPKVFDLLAGRIIPDLVRIHPPSQPLRAWIAGCSTGEETYSLAMLLREQISAAKRDIRLQIFASDVDPDAIVSAREGLYPETIEADVSPERLARFFSKEDHGYRVSPELRAAIVFTVQDILVDAPFSRLDLVSCRNLLIYLRPEAQERIISLFHFALREGGILLLGNSETAGDVDGRFEVIAKSERVYRHVGRSRPGEFGLLLSPDGLRTPTRLGQGHPPSRESALADLCRRLVMETYAPAAVLINNKHECLYYLGPTDRYLRVAPGHPVHDVLAMAREGVRTKLRSAIQRATQENARVVVPGGHDGDAASFSIDARPVLSDGEKLLLICFVDDPKPKRKGTRAITQPDVTRVAQLEQELEVTRTELQGAVRDLELSNEELKAINEEAMSAQEEYQSTNEELLTSKEELQSLNEELTALNSQLQETLERQRTTSNDLQNILYSTDVATLFLDTNLHIRFFTPATKLLFSVIPTDVGRPLADLHSLASDGALLSDARAVLWTAMPIEREIEAQSGAWYVRRILPYRTQDNGVEGVVITFADITERRHTADALAAAKRQADLATAAKSRFLTAASHDLRQPLQTVGLIRAVLARKIKDNKNEEALRLVARLDETAVAMSGMLNALLDINQIEAGTIRAQAVNFPVNNILDLLRDEFTYLAQAQGLDLRVVSCGLLIRSDPRLLEQIIRNLLSNALKYTRDGKVLLGCRRRQGMLSIEVCDTGVGIAGPELQAIFDEYHQLDNAARERSRGFGLGLSIVQRLANLLGHSVRVRSRPGKGSIFAIEVMLARAEPVHKFEYLRHGADDGIAEDVRQRGVIIVVEDDPDVRDLLQKFLTDEGHQTLTAADGIAALELAARAKLRPDLVLVDYNLPNEMNGLQVAAALRETLHRDIPVVVLTGDISTSTLRDIARQDCVRLTKPVSLDELTRVIQQRLKISAARAHPPYIAEAAENPALPVIFIVDDDIHVCESIRVVIEEHGWSVKAYPTCEAFLEAYHPGREACLLVDAYVPGMNGLELLRRLNELDHHLPAIMITGNSDVPMVVQAMKAGASDVIEKPVGHDELLTSIGQALERARDSKKLSAWRENASNHFADLSPREREVMHFVLAGRPNKNIAADLGISQRTVENHRASIMRKTGSKSLPALARMAVAAGWYGAD